MENIKDLLEGSLKIATNVNFFVKINKEKSEQMTYLKLGTFLITNAEKIKIVTIILEN